MYASEKQHRLLLLQPSGAGSRSEDNMSLYTPLIQILVCFVIAYTFRLFLKVSDGETTPKPSSKRKFEKVKNIPPEDDSTNKDLSPSGGEAGESDATSSKKPDPGKTKLVEIVEEDTGEDEAVSKDKDESSGSEAWESPPPESPAIPVNTMDDDGEILFEESDDEDDDSDDDGTDGLGKVNLKEIEDDIGVPDSPTSSILEPTHDSPQDKTDPLMEIELTSDPVHRNIQESLDSTLRANELPSNRKQARKCSLFQKCFSCGASQSTETP